MHLEQGERKEINLKPFSDEGKTSRGQEKMFSFVGDDFVGMQFPTENRG